MNSLAFFEFRSDRVRTIVIDGNIAFCLSDVMLGMGSATNASRAKSLIDEGFGEGMVIVHTLETPGGVQDMLFVFEAGLTFLLSRSRTEMGKQLNRLIHTEILPSLRKTGKYQVGQPAIAQQQSNGLIAAREVSEIEMLLANNPRLAQLCIDDAMNRVVGQKAIAPTAEPMLRGVNEIALEMGFKTDSSSRVKLGQFIKTQGFVPTKEKRICNGVMTDINCYPDTPDLRAAIARFFS
jgi:prophage antirepressor-like protein